MAMTAPPAGLSIFYSKTGELPTSAYGTPLIPYAGTGPKLIPPTMEAITLVSSVVGGNLVYKDNQGDIYQFKMSPNVQYSLFLLVGTGVVPPQILLSGTDWQGNAAINNITDLTYYGY